jgi:hypothetical protein
MQAWRIDSIVGTAEQINDFAFCIIFADFGIEKLYFLTRQGFIDKYYFAIDMSNAAAVMGQRFDRDFNRDFRQWFSFGSVTCHVYFCFQLPED